MNASADSAALQSLLRHALPRLRAAGMSLVDFQQAANDDAGPLWFVRSGYLALQLPRFRAAFTPRAISGAELGDRLRQPAPTFNVLKVRSEDLGVDFIEIKLETASGNEVRFRPGTATALDDDHLLSELSSLTQTPVVQQVAVELPSSRNLVCDLEEGIARSRTRGAFYVTELLEYGLPLLTDLTPAEERAVSSLVGEDDVAATTNDSAEGVEDAEDVDRPGSE